MEKKKYYEEVKISSEYRIVIPLIIRRLAGLEVGDTLKIYLGKGGKIIMEKKEKEEEKK